jgi:hypothetical protein
MTSGYPLRALRRRLAQCTFVLASWIGCAVAGHAQTSSATSPGRHFDHVIVVVMENEGTRQALADPNIAELVRSGAWFSNYHGLAHPSQPNYLGLVGGSTFGIDHDHTPPPIKHRSIVSRLEEKGLSWKAYAEDYPGGCFLGSGAGKGYLTPKAKPTELYARKHVPLLAFASIQNDRARCNRVVNAREFMRDARAGKLPNYSFYSPNMFNDGHDTSLETSTEWLRRFVQSLKTTAGMRQRTLLMITWDEGGGEDFRSNRVLAILIGDGIVPGRYADRLTHYSLLRTIEDNFGLLPVAAGDANASSVPDKVWRE